MTAPATATTMTTASDNLLSDASTPPSRHAISPGKIKPRKVDASSAGIANTTSNAIQLGNRKICSTRLVMGTSSRITRHTVTTQHRKCATKCPRRTRHGSWHHEDVSVIVVFDVPVADRNHLPRRHECRRRLYCGRAGPASSRSLSKAPPVRFWLRQQTIPTYELQRRRLHPCKRTCQALASTIAVHRRQSPRRPPHARLRPCVRRPRRRRPLHARRRQRRPRSARPRRRRRPLARPLPARQQPRRRLSVRLRPRRPPQPERLPRRRPRSARPRRRRPRQGRLRPRRPLLARQLLARQQRRRRPRARPPLARLRPRRPLRARPPLARLLPARQQRRRRPPARLRPRRPEQLARLPPARPRPARPLRARPPLARLLPARQRPSGRPSVRPLRARPQSGRRRFARQLLASVLRRASPAVT